MKKIKQRKENAVELYILLLKEINIDSYLI